MNNRAFIIVAVLLLSLVLTTHLLTLRFNTLLEPDAYIYLGVIEHTVANHLTLSSPFSSAPYNERADLIYLVAVPSYYLHIPPIDIFLALPAIFSVLDGLAVMILTWQFIKDKRVVLYALLFYLLISANLVIPSKNDAGDYRGEAFVPFFVAIAISALVETFRTESYYKIYVYLLTFLACLFISIELWSGGVYIFAVVLLFFLIIGIYYFADVKKIYLFYLIFSVNIILLVTLPSLNYLTGLNIGVPVTISEVLPSSVFTLFLSFGVTLILLPLALLFYYQDVKKVDSIAFLGVISVLTPTLIVTIYQIRWSSLALIPLAIFAGYALNELLDRAHDRQILYIILPIQITLFLIGAVLTAPLYSINPAFLHAIAWVDNNTSSNSTFLTLWQDGSLIEGLGNRSSYTDSISGLNNTRVDAFARFLFARSGNLTYLNTVPANYLLIQRYYATVANGIGQEAGRTNWSINGTNLYSLTNNESTLPVVFNDGNTIIYRLK